MGGTTTSIVGVIEELNKIHRPEELDRTGQYSYIANIANKIPKTCIVCSARFSNISSVCMM